jgi:general secretion pathway protein F
MLIHLIHSGEQSGRLADLLQKAASSQEEDVEALIQSALSLFEPLMIVVMGGIVLFIVLAVMLPIFSLDQLAGQT